jgi:hypothetical protein
MKASLKPSSRFEKLKSGYLFLLKRVYSRTNVENEEEASMIRESKPKIRSRRLNSAELTQTTETKELPTSEQDDGTPPPNISEAVSPSMS